MTPVDLLAPLLHGPAVDNLFAPEQQVALMVRFEVALAYALEESGVAPAGTGAATERGAAGFPAEQEFEAIASEAVSDGNLAIPFLRRLTVHLRKREARAADFLHFGATSQDLLDTVLALQLGQVTDLLLDRIQRFGSRLSHAAMEHRFTLLPGRTWLQQGPPVSFGLKAAQALSVLLRDRERLLHAREHASCLQLGGAVGTLASLGSKGVEVARALGYRLTLRVPDTPWHAQRDGLAEFASALAILCGTLAKFARDLALMSQTEVGEISVAPPGGGGSSTMPHKRNPVPLAVAISAGIRAPHLAAIVLAALPQEHERGLGGWHAEWETLPELCAVACGAVEAMCTAFEDLEVNASAMQRNLHMLHGLPMAEAVSLRLAQTLGRPAAHELVAAAARECVKRNMDLLAVLLAMPDVRAELTREQLAELLDPSRYVGSTDAMIDRVLARAAQVFAPPEAGNAVR